MATQNRIACFVDGKARHISKHKGAYKDDYQKRQWRNRYPSCVIRELMPDENVKRNFKYHEKRPRSETAIAWFGILPVGIGDGLTKKLFGLPYNKISKDQIDELWERVGYPKYYRESEMLAFLKSK